MNPILYRLWLLLILSKIKIRPCPLPRHDLYPLLILIPISHLSQTQFLHQMLLVKILRSSNCIVPI